jgi:hypothetical protein
MDWISWNPRPSSFASIPNVLRKIFGTIWGDKISMGEIQEIIRPDSNPNPVFSFRSFALPLDRTNLSDGESVELVQFDTRPTSWNFKNDSC